MLLGDLFKYAIVEKGEGVLKANISLNSKHKVFEGHFPGVPVLPGVCQVQAVKELLQVATSSTLQYSKVRDIKFMSMVIPNEMETLQCEMTYKQEEDGYKTTALLSFGEKSILKLRANLSIVE